MNEVGENTGTMLACFVYHPVNRVFIQFQDARRGSDTIALRRQTDDHLDGISGVFATEESRVSSFREPFFASITLKKLSVVFSVSSGFYDVSLSSYSIMDTGFVNTKVLVNFEHVFFPLS